MRFVVGLRTDLLPGTLGVTPWRSRAAVLGALLGLVGLLASRDATLAHAGSSALAANPQQPTQQAPAQQAPSQQAPAQQAPAQQAPAQQPAAPQPPDTQQTGARQSDTQRPAVQAPSPLSGQPQAVPSQHASASVWVEGERVHVRFNSPQRAAKFGGKVCARAPLRDVQGVRLGPQDSLLLRAKERCIWLKIQSREGTRAGNAVGFSFQRPAQAVIFDLLLGKRQLPAERILIGQGGARPESSPFALPKPAAGH